MYLKMLAKYFTNLVLIISRRVEVLLSTTASAGKMTRADCKSHFVLMSPSPVGATCVMGTSGVGLSPVSRFADPNRVKLRLDTVSVKILPLSVRVRVNLKTEPLNRMTRGKKC